MTNQGPVHATSAILDLCLSKTRAVKSRIYRDVIGFKKFRFQNVFCPTRKRKSGVLKFLLFKECFH